MPEWIFNKPGNGSAHRPLELSSQPRWLLVIPLLSREQIIVHFRTNHQLKAHSPNLRLNPASNCSHGMAAAGSRSCAAIRDSMSNLSASDKGSSASSQPPPSQSANLRRITSRSCFESLGSSSRISAVLMHGNLAQTRVFVMRKFPPCHGSRKPASEAVIYAASNPPTMARKPILAISLRRSGASEPMPPT